jgi:FAD/FMN-containing dehydrogenase
MSILAAQAPERPLTEARRALLARLSARFDNRFSTGTALREQHANTLTWIACQPPDAVVFAETTQEVVEVVRLCAEARVPIIPFGTGTSLEGQVNAPFGGVSLDLSYMNRILTVHAEDFDCVVEPGVTRKALNEHLRDLGLFFSIDPGADASLGGMAATRASGTNAVRYGTMRDNVLSLTAVMADGTLLKTGNRARKSASGYDLTRLLIGSEGTLGIITAAVLRLFPRPAATVTAFAGLEHLDSATAFFSRAYGLAGPSLTAFELMPRVGLDFVLRHADGTKYPLKAPHHWYALFELSSPQEGNDVTSLAEMLLSEGIESGQIGDAVIASSLAQERELWRLRELMSEVQKHEGGSIKHDVAVPVARVPEFIARANQLVELMIPGARPVPFGHLGDGNIHYNVSQPPSMDRAVFLANWEALNAAVHEIVLDLGGSISAEHGIGRLKRDLLRHAKAPLELEMMRKIKQAFDPNGILNPGKLL